MEARQQPPPALTGSRSGHRNPSHLGPPLPPALKSASGTAFARPAHQRSSLRITSDAPPPPGFTRTTAPRFPSAERIWWTTPRSLLADPDRPLAIPVAAAVCAPAGTGAGGRGCNRPLHSPPHPPLLTTGPRPRECPIALVHPPFPPPVVVSLLTGLGVPPSSSVRVCNLGSYRASLLRSKNRLHLRNFVQALGNSQEAALPESRGRAFRQDLGAALLPRAGSIP